MWYETWLASLRAGLDKALEHLPAIGAALLLVLAGFACSHVARRWTRALSARLLERIAARKRTIGTAIDTSGARGSTPALVSGFVFWMLLLVFVAAAVEVLGLPLMSDLLAKLAAYVPNILAASLIVLGAIVVGRIVRAATLRAAESAGLSHSSAIAAVVEGVIIVLAALMALEQLGISGRVLELTLAVVVGSALAALALAFGLGARSSVANLIAAQYLARTVRVGQVLSIDGLEGSVIELTSTSVVLETRDGRVLVPAQNFHERAILILREDA